MIGKSITYFDLVALAQAHGGKILTSRYLGPKTLHRWECAQGHIWKATWNSVNYNGSWCPVCAKEKRSQKRKLSIADLQCLARDRGGRCLSDEYGRIFDRYQWQCRHGHRFQLTGYQVKHNQLWCPFC